LVQAGQDKIPTDVFYMKQTVHNACGTVGVIHSLANSLDNVQLLDGTLKGFLEETAKMNPMERGLALENSNNISEAHEEIASEGQTEVPNRDDNLVTHFVAFIHKNGLLYEMDGRRQFPVNHGPTTADSLLKVCICISKKVQSMLMIC
jgi:ubiquitin carboxyl-terminal hydrolase L3